MSLWGHIGKSNSVSADLSEEKLLACDNINMIYIKNLHTDINIFPSSANDIRIQLYGTNSDNREPNFNLTVTNDNESIIITVESRKKLKFLMKGNHKLNVYIPQNYTNDIKVDTSEGTITIASLNLHLLEVKATSGHILANDLTTQTSKLHNTSGQIKLLGFSGNLRAESSSGSIKIEYETFSENSLNLKSSSGSIQLQLPEESAFYLIAKALSGTVESKFPIASRKAVRNYIEGSVNGGTNKITTSSGSGSIMINKY